MLKPPSVPQLTINPQTPLADEPVSIRVSGLPPTCSVTLRTLMTAENGMQWTSQAMFISTKDGTLDVRSQAPVEGSYTGVDPMGLVWSMEAQPSETPPTLFAKQTLKPTTVQVEVLIDGSIRASGQFHQQAFSPGVKRIEVRERGLRGTLFLPPEKGPHPGVIVIGGSGGGLQEGRAALLASRGYAALALAYFAYEDLPKYLVDIPLEYFETALDWMLNRTDIRSRGIVAMGGSRGGEGVLLLGSQYPQVCGVIANVPSHVLWQGFGDPDATLPCYAWTKDGEGLEPMANFGSEEQWTTLYQQDPIPLTPLFETSLEDAAAVENAAIPVERINGPVLLISGADDAMWPSATMATAVFDRLKEKGFAHSVSNLIYENAGHLILPPYRPTTVNAAPHPVDGQNYAFGGTPAGGAFANRNSWAKTLDFLREVFG